MAKQYNEQIKTLWKDTKNAEKLKQKVVDEDFFVMLIFGWAFKVVHIKQEEIKAVAK